MGAFSTSCRALREPLRHPLPAEHKAAASRVRAGAWAEPSPQHSLEGKMSCTARSTPVPPCAGQSCCSPPGTSCELCAELMGWHGHREGAGEELEQLRDPPAGVQGPWHILVLPAWHRLGDLQLWGVAEGANPVAQGYTYPQVTPRQSCHPVFPLQHTDCAAGLHPADLGNDSSCDGLIPCSPLWPLGPCASLGLPGESLDF